MDIIINNLDDLAIFNEDLNNANIEKVQILGIDVTKFVGTWILARKLENEILRKYAIDRNILELCNYLFKYEEVILNNTLIDKKFKDSLSSNDKIILISTHRLMNLAQNYN